MADNTVDLETLKETLRLEIRKELKIKEGAEKLQRASVDRRSRSYVASILKKCNEKLEDLHLELNQLLALVPDDQEGEIFFFAHSLFSTLSLLLSVPITVFQFFLYFPEFSFPPQTLFILLLSSLTFCSPPDPVIQDHLPGSPPVHRKTAQIHTLEMMEKQLAVEQRVKEGAESMIRTITKAKAKQDRALLSKAQQMLADSRQKVEVLKMRILKLRSDSLQVCAGEADEKKPLASTPEGRIVLLKYRVDVETRLLQGARSIVKAQSDKKSDKKHLEMVRLGVISRQEFSLPITGKERSVFFSRNNHALES